MGGKLSKTDYSESVSIPQEKVLDSETLRANAIDSLQMTRDNISKYDKLLASTIEKLKSNPTDPQLASNKTSVMKNLITLRKKAIELQKQIANYNLELGKTTGGSRVVKKYTQYRKRNPRKRTRKYRRYVKKLFK